MDRKNGMNRRQFIRTMAAASALAALGPAGCLESLKRNKVSRKPNILMIMSDEHSADVLGSLGNDIVRTPNIDGIAEKGVVFENCYCNSPLCVPSRFSFISGKYASRVNVWSNNCWLPSDDYPSLPRILTSAGYDSFVCGKMHFDTTRRYGFTEIGESVQNRHHKTGTGKRLPPEDLRPSGVLSSRFKDFRPGDDSQILSHDRKTTEEAVRFLKERKADDNPFFVLTGYLAPHFPLIVPQKYWQVYKGKVPVPRIPEGHLESQPRNYRQLRYAFQVDNAPDEIVRKGRELYYGLTQWLDDQIGEVLKALGESEIADNTIVIYTTDHGEMIGEHGMWWKNCMYEQASRVPLVVSWPGRWENGQRRTKVCSLVDLNRTIAEITGADTPDDWNGQSMVDWFDNPEAEWKDFAVSEYYGHFITSGFAMLRTGKYKYVYHTPADNENASEQELYDLEDDPGEFVNLAAAPRHEERVRGMHDDLVRELGESPDKAEQRCRADYARGYSR